MWWPRPRWKSDIFTRFVLLLLFIITTTTSKNAVMADEGQQHCGSSNMSAVVWTTVLCTMLLILAIVAIYFVYCKKREHDWSSLWWKSNSEKNLVLQTSAPVKNQQLKNGGTDNPAFSADAYTGDYVIRTGLTRVVRVPSSTIGEGLLINELLSKEEDGRKIYVYKHSDGSKDQLVALRLVFEKELQQQQQLSRPPASDLSRALIELSRKYGLHVELETEGEAVVESPSPVAKADETATKCAKSNILSAVRGKAQRLWHQGQVVFKGGDGGGRVDVDKEIVVGDIETGRVEAVHAGKAPPIQKSPCSVTTINETEVAERPARNSVGPLQYRTLEYGASPADAEAHSSPDSGVQCCTVNLSEPTSDKSEAVAAVVAMADGEVVAAEKDVAMRVAVGLGEETVKSNGDEASIVVPDKNAAAVLETVDDGKKPVTVKPKSDETKHSNPPPPPPPRKYSAPVVPSAPTTAVTVPRATAGATATASVADAGIAVTGRPETGTAQLPVSCAETVKPSDAAGNEIRVDDDYYWCTTTAMAPPMSTFGKRPSVTPSINSGAAEATIVGGAAEATIVGGAAEATIVGGAAEATIVGGAAEATIVGGAAEATIVDGAAAAPGVCDKGAVVAVTTADGADSGRDVVAGATTSIEDASLPSFSSDEDEDDDDDNFAADKTKFPSCNSNADTSADGRVSGVGNDSGKCVGGTVADTPTDDSPNNDGSAVAAAEPKSPTKLPTLRLSLSTPLSSTTNTSYCSSSASSSTSTSPSPTNSSGTINNSPIVSKIPVRRQSAGSGVTAVSTPLTNGTAKKSIPLPLSRSGSRLAMWSSAN